MHLSFISGSACFNLSWPDNECKNFDFASTLITSCPTGKRNFHYLMKSIHNDQKGRYLIESSWFVMIQQSEFQLTDLRESNYRKHLVVVYVRNDWYKKVESSTVDVNERNTFNWRTTLRSNQDFCVVRERSTLETRGYTAFLRTVHEHFWHLHMFYLPISNPEFPGSFNLVPRVLRLFGQRFVVRRDSGEFQFQISWVLWVRNWGSLGLS